METSVNWAHPTRTGLVRNVEQIVGICVHTSEGGEGLNSAENLAAFTASPRTSANLASYHAITDTDKIIITVPDNRQAYSAGGGNRTFLHICIPGRVAQTREQWLDAISREYIWQCAQYIVEKGRQYNIPFHKLSVAEVQGGRVRGYCGHRDISQAFKQSTHTDPYPNFPWDVLAGDIAALTPPPPPEPWPIFDPANGKYSLWPLGTKPDVTAFMQGDAVRYAKGVMRDHTARFLRWFSTVEAYSWMWNDCAFVQPDTGVHHLVNRQALMRLGLHWCEQLNPNDPMFERTLYDAVVCVQAAWSGLTIENFYCGVLPVDGRISNMEGANGMWRLIDSLSDGGWG